MEGFAGPQVLAEAAAQAMNKLDYTAQHMGMRIDLAKGLTKFDQRVGSKCAETETATRY